MDETEKYMLATAGLMVFGVLFASQVAYLIFRYSIALYFQILLGGFWCGFFAITHHKITKEKKLKEAENGEKSKEETTKKQ